MNSKLDDALTALPLIAILRGIKPTEVLGIGHALYEVGFRVLEVPLNSPDALKSINALVQGLPRDAVVGAGTVLSIEAVDAVREAGGELIVMPHADVSVVSHAKARGMSCIPGAATPTEAFACVSAGADAVKLFPAEMVTPNVVKAIRAVLPHSLRLFPVGGVSPEGMSAFARAGAAGFGLGSALYSPGLDAEEVKGRGLRFVQAWQSLHS